MLDLAGMDWSIHTAATISVGRGAAIAGVICFWVFALLAVVGRVHRRARAAPLWVWAVPLLMYLSVVFLVVETPRYRTAIDPFIVLLAALALTRLRALAAERAGVPQPVVVRLRQPPLGVRAPALDQRAGELGREEQVAHQLAVQRVGVGVDEPAEERELRRAVRVQEPAVVAAEDVAGDLADRVARRAARRRCTGSGGAARRRRRAR